jgi:hypothetical protein
MHCYTDITTTTTQSFLGLFLLPLRFGRTALRFSHKLLKLEAARAAITSSLRKFNRPVRNAALLRNFKWYNVLAFIIGETLFTFTVSILTFILVLLLAGFWKYISQEHLSKIGIIFSYFPLAGIYDDFMNYPVIMDLEKIYDTNIKPLIFKPSKLLLNWEIFKTFVLDFFYVTVFKLSMATIHEWDNIIQVLADMDIDLKNKWDALIKVLAFNISIIHVYFINPTLDLVKSVISIPFKGLTPLFATNWIGDIVWCISSYYTKFQEYYWRYICNYEYVQKPIQRLKEFYYENGNRVYTGKLYEAAKPYVSLVDGEKEALKSVEGEKLVIKTKAAEFEEGSSTKNVQQTPLEEALSNNVEQSGRTSPVEEQAKAVQSEWSGTEEQTPKVKGKQIEPQSPDSVDSTDSLASTESGKQRQLGKYFPNETLVETPKASKINHVPLYVKEVPNQSKSVVNPIYQGVGVEKDGKVLFYERQPVTFNHWKSVGGPDMYHVQPDREHGINGIVSWKYFLMTNSTVISVLCFSPTLITGLAIKGIIKLGLDTVVAL